MSLDKLDAENQRELEFLILLVGEGKADASFLMKLMDRRGIANLHFGFPTSETGGYGWTGLGKYLSSLQPRTGFDVLRAVMVFYDNDNDPTGMFHSVRARISATDLYTLPNEPAKLSVADGQKKRTILVPMPQVGVPGAMETLMLQSAVGNGAAVACVDAFATCANVAHWDASHQAKMRLRGLIAATCRGNSDMTLTNIWSVTGNPIDLAHHCFDALVQIVNDVVAAA